VIDSTAHFILIAFVVVLVVVVGGSGVEAVTNLIILATPLPPPPPLSILTKTITKSVAVEDLYNTTLAFISLLNSTPARAIENGLGDWMTLEPPALGLTGWGFAHISFLSASVLGEAVGDTESAAAAADSAAAAAAMLNSLFLSSEPTSSALGLYSCLPSLGCKSSSPFNGTQCGQAMPLYLGIVPPAARSGALSYLVASVEAARGHLSVGSFGIKWLLRALGDGGRPDLAYGIMAAQDYPSFGYMMSSAANGVENATTAWESWGFSDSTFSHNHPMFTSGSTYFFQSLAGIRLEDSARGADKFLLTPQPPPSHLLEAVNASWSTVAGDVGSSWVWINSSCLSLHFSLPPNVKATVTLPNSKQVFSLGSGEYDFLDPAQGQQQ